MGGALGEGGAGARCPAGVFVPWPWCGGLAGVFLPWPWAAVVAVPWVSVGPGLGGLLACPCHGPGGPLGGALGEGGAGASGVLVPWPRTCVAAAPEGLGFEAVLWVPLVLWVLGVPGVLWAPGVRWGLRVPGLLWVPGSCGWALLWWPWAASSWRGGRWFCRLSCWSCRGSLLGLGVALCCGWWWP